jgi:hypothetical protein
MIVSLEAEEGREEASREEGHWEAEGR